MNTSCRRCSDCVGMSHHWIDSMLAPDDPEFEPGTHACKHCDQRGDMCDACDGDGCEKCGMEGVIPLTQEEYDLAMQLSVDGLTHWENMVGDSDSKCRFCGEPYDGGHRCGSCGNGDLFDTGEFDPMTGEQR